MPKVKVVKYVAVNPAGEVTGPVGDKEFVKTALVIGFFRAVPSASFSDEEAWNVIKKNGYKVYKAKVELIREVTYEGESKSN